MMLPYRGARAFRVHYRIYRLLQWLVYLIPMFLALAITAGAQTPKSDPLYAQPAHTEERIISRVSNLPRLLRAWNSLQPATAQWNAAMSQADLLIHDRFKTRVIDVSDEKRRATVIQYKAAREALLKELDALNELIDEEEW